MAAAFVLLDLWCFDDLGESREWPVWRAWNSCRARAVSSLLDSNSTGMETTEGATERVARTATKSLVENISFGECNFCECLALFGTQTGWQLRVMGGRQGTRSVRESGTKELG